MINLITKLPQSQVEEIVNYLNEVIQPQLSKDVSTYARGRTRSWFPYEAPLSDSQSFKLGLDDQKIWDFTKEVCQSFGWTPDLGLVSKGGSIKPHRDASYADFKSIGINLGKVTWCYERIYPDFSWVSPEKCLNPSEIIKLDMTGGEVFEFNCKNPHWTENVDPDRWAFNMWRISRKKRDEFNEFISLDRNIQTLVSQPISLKDSMKEFFGEEY